MSLLSPLSGCRHRSVRVRITDESLERPVVFCYRPEGDLGRLSAEAGLAMGQPTHPCRNTTSTPAIRTRTPRIPGATASNMGKPRIGTGESKQKRAKTKVLKPDWQKHQGPPAAHYALAKAKGFDFYVTDRSLTGSRLPTAEPHQRGLGGSQARRRRSHRRHFCGHRRLRALREQRPERHRPPECH